MDVCHGWFELWSTLRWDCILIDFVRCSWMYTPAILVPYILGSYPIWYWWGCAWWRHQMETFSALLALCAGIHRSRWIPRTKASDAELWFFFFDLHVNKWFSKQWWSWWFETASRPLLRHCNVVPKGWGFAIGCLKDYWQLGWPNSGVAA